MADSVKLNCFPGYRWDDYEHRCVPNPAGELTRAEKRIYPDAERGHQMDPVEQAATHTMRQFSTGAIRDTDVNKPDYQGYLSPLALHHYGRYMLKHQKQADGVMRQSDNWKKGIPESAYVKSLIRHVVEFWLAHETYDIAAEEEALDAILFNTMGILHEREKARLEAKSELEVGA